MKTNVLFYLEKTTEEHPNKTALDDGKNTLTFQELQEKAKRIGAYIHKELGVTNKAVFVTTDRSIHPIVAFLGVLYSGNYYVPIDDKTPSLRLNQMVDKIKPAAIITMKEIDVTNSFYKLISFGEAISHQLDLGDQIVFNRIRNQFIDTNPCYILFTSGSTGTPKGVVISHRAVIDLTEWLNQVTMISSDDTIGNQTPFFFDASVKDIFQMLKSGATLYVLQPQSFVFTKDLFTLLRDKNITVILWAASAIAMVANSGILELESPRQLRLITFAGEQLFTRHLNQWRKACPEATFINLYGPTETTVDCLYYVLDRDFSDDEVIPLGYACQNKEVFLVDENNQKITKGIGEICVRGTGVGLGYYDDKEKSNEVFIQNPDHNLYRDYVYKTGDLAYYNHNGELVFVSRKDHQIKRQGYRIELGEIEASLILIGGIKEVGCVFDRESEKIIAFFTGKEATTRELNKKLLDHLPKIMHPDKYIYLDQMLYTRNGKVDKRRLLEKYKQS
jgi:D-alanine--poly(phosphoribitol) ligase subunit 1